MVARKPTAQDIANLLEWIENGDDPAAQRSVIRWCRDNGVDRGPVHEALRADEWANRYARACEQRGLDVADAIHDVAEKAMTGEIKADAARVAVDAYKWTSSRLLAPKRLGEKLDVTSDGKALPAATVFVVGRDVSDRVVSESDDPGGSDG